MKMNLFYVIKAKIDINAKKIGLIRNKTEYLKQIESSLNNLNQM